MGEVIMGRMGHLSVGNWVVGRGERGWYSSFFAMIFAAVLLFAGSAAAAAPYTITFNSNGGTAITQTIQTDADGKLQSLPPTDPTREGYKFEGWYTTSGTIGGLQVLVGGYTFTANTTVYARWTEVYKVWTITFSPNGGSALTVTSAKTTETGRAAAWPADPARTGYDFGGWYTNSGATGGDQVNEYTVFTASKTIYARWILKTYTITFDPNGGMVTTMSGTTGTGWKLSSLPTPTARTGYTFDGWYTAVNDGDKVTTSYAFDGTISIIYAHWKPIVYKIKDNLDGGTLELPNPAEYTIESNEITLLPPTKIAYSFAGWTSPDITSPQKDVYIKTGSMGDKTFTAKWTPEFYTIRFEVNGGVLAVEETKTVAGGTISALPTPAAKPGYTFDAWYTADNGGVKVESGKTVFGGDALIYARWTPITYKITYNLNGGTLVYSIPATYTIETPSFELHAPVRPAYTFEGWTGSNGTLPEPSVYIEQGVAMGDKSYAANWTPNYYTITFEPKGGAMTQESAGTILGGKLETLPMPLKEGNIFEGWFATEIGGTKITTSTVFDGDATIYAMWTPIYTITFYANGGTVSQISGTTGSGGKLANLPTPTRNGYTFEGWFTEETGGTKITAASVFSKDMTIYAQWTLITYVAVTFSAVEHGTLTATVDGNPIASGALIQRGKNVVFTAAPASGYGVGGWTVNGAAVSGAAGTYTLSNIPAASTVTVSFVTVSVATPDRVIPGAGSDVGAAAIAPVSPLTAEFTAGPNPVGASLGAVKFFLSGSRVKEAALTIYDASGNAVNRVNIGAGADIGGKGKRPVASWDLRDAKGRPVAEGTYLVKGVIKTAGGKREPVSAVVGVRGR
jgi:uncharacterized repeat protein (TIGR02543 family)